MGVHGPDHRADELVLQVGAGRELGQRVVQRLLLQGLALLQPVADIGPAARSTIALGFSPPYCIVMTFRSVVGRSVGGLARYLAASSA